MNTYNGRLGLQQRVLPNYRVPFFDLLAGACDAGLSIFAGAPRASEMIVSAQPGVANYRAATNIHMFVGPAYLCYQRGFIAWLEEWSPDALIVEANPRYLATSSAVRWMHARGRKVIGWGLGAPNAGAFRNSRRLAFLNRFDGLIAYSHRGAVEYAALGFPRDKIFVAHNAVVPAPSQPPPSHAQPPDQKPTLLFVGRLQARKRVDHLIRACAEVESQPHLILVGDGPQRAELESLASRIYPSAEFVGAKHGAELELYFLDADLFVLPGTGGLAVQEAMSYGLPVIVAKGDGTQDDLVRATNGWQIPPDDYPALLSAVKNALADSARLREMGKESFRIVSQEVNIDKMVQVFVQALNSIG